jgi:hypothetical protein
MPKDDIDFDFGSNSFEFENNEISSNPISLDDNVDNHEIIRETVPISSPSTNEIKNRNSNFIFFFGNPQSGKSVILSSLLYQLSTEYGVLSPRNDAPNSKEVKTLLYDFYENMQKGILPERSSVGKVLEIDLLFTPNNKSKKVPPINITFLEASGEDLAEIKRGGKFNSTISKYLSAGIPLTFILVTSYETAHLDDALLNEFLDEVQQKLKNIQNINIILVISKWDLSGSLEIDSPDVLDDFIQKHLRRLNQRIDSLEMDKSYFTVGSIEKNNGNQRITLLVPKSASILSNWLYEGITGYPLNYEGTFWERIKFSFQ